MRVHAHRYLAVLSLTFGLGCTGGTDEPALQPPSGTGGSVIEMDGDWIATEVEILEQVGGSATPGPPPTRLLPPVVGSTFTIGPSGFLDLDGSDVTTMCTPDDFVERFASRNRQDGRFAWLDIGCRTRPDPRIADGGSSRVQCAFGAVTANRMLGYVRIEVHTAPRPAEIPSLGLYRVVIERR